MRITNKRIRQFLLTTGETVDPNTVPDTIQMYNSDGSPFNLDAVMALNSGRRNVVITTGSLTAAADTGKVSTRLAGGGSSGTVDLSVGALLTKIAVSKPSRVRLYTTAAHRDADIARNRFTDPMDFGGVGATPNHGCLTEFLLLTTLALENIPADYLYSAAAGDDNIYYRIDNYDLTAGPVTVTLTIKDVER